MRYYSGSWETGTITQPTLFSRFSYDCYQGSHDNLLDIPN